jgi:ankyrin repeat protein
MFEIVKPRQSTLFFLPTSNPREDLLIHLAAYGGHTDVVKWTVECGVRIDGRNRKGSNELDIATERGNTELLQNIGSNIFALINSAKSKNINVFLNSFAHEKLSC